METMSNVTIIGAGPYGLSIAAHLAARHIPFRIIGEPMGFWNKSMPESMLLKSEAFASTLFDPHGKFTLARYCRDAGLPYRATGMPVPRRVFYDYGIAFQKRFAPDLIPQRVVRLDKMAGGYRIDLDDGSSQTARQVIVACGVEHFGRIPTVVGQLSDEVVTHTSHIADPGKYFGRSIAVLGSGSSAIDAACFLTQAGATVHLLTRRPTIWFSAPPETGVPPLQRLYRAIRKPRSGLGTNWRSFVACTMPDLFHAGPARLREKITRKHLGPSGGWTSRDMFAKVARVDLNAVIRKASLSEGKVEIEFGVQARQAQKIVVDHVVVGTGYRPDVSALPFLTREILGELETEFGTPVLSRRFESSMPGLYFAGPIAANSFGPMLRFAWGARFASRRISRALAAG